MAHTYVHCYVLREIFLSITYVHTICIYMLHTRTHVRTHAYTCTRTHTRIYQLTSSRYSTPLSSILKWALIPLCVLSLCLSNASPTPFKLTCLRTWLPKNLQSNTYFYTTYVLYVRTYMQCTYGIAQLYLHFYMCVQVWKHEIFHM